jgi:hypothetical protein
MKLRQVDQDALERAMKMCAAESPGRAHQLREKLKDESWFDVARFAAYCVQGDTLNLDLSEHPPCVVGVDEAGPAGDLLRRMLKAGVSRWEPDPLQALGIEKPSDDD